MPKNIALIMAGGVGERFWPMTGETLPKYAISLDRDYKKNRGLSLLGLTYKRLKALYGDDIYVITAEKHVQLIKRLLPALPQKHILHEPYRRNTAGAVTLAHFILSKKYGADTVVSIFPADHLIQNKRAFEKCIRECILYARTKQNIAMLGIKPTFPATGFGYIEYGRPSGDFRGAHRVRRFVEKPDFARAKAFVRSRRFLWNGGIFTWQMGVFEREMKKYASGFYRRFENALANRSTFSKRNLRSLFHQLPSAPIDKILIERTRALCVFRADMGWSDIGTWDALRRELMDENRNLILAQGVFDDVSSSFVKVSPETRIILAGVRNLSVIQYGNNILICDNGRTQDVAKLMKRFK